MNVNAMKKAPPVGNVEPQYTFTREEAAILDEAPEGCFAATDQALRGAIAPVAIKKATD